MWQIDLKKECPDLFETTKDWLSGKYDLFFTEKILEFDENKHRLMFVPVGEMKSEPFLTDLYAQAFYLLYWNHFDIIRDSDFDFAKSEVRKKKRFELLRKEFEMYYRALHAPGELPYKVTPKGRVNITSFIYLMFSCPSVDAPGGSARTF